MAHYTDGRVWSDEHKAWMLEPAPEATRRLGDVDWLMIGATDEFAELKREIAHVCRDVGGFIDEVCTHDIVKTFRKHGFEVVGK